MIEIFPIVNLRDQEQAYQQTESALEQGADGVFLLDPRHESTEPEKLIDTYDYLRQKLPDAYIGVNIQQTPDVYDVFDWIGTCWASNRIKTFPSALWAGNPRETFDNPEYSGLGHLEYIADFRNRNNDLYEMRFIGGAAYRGALDETDDPETAAILAEETSRYVDVVVTSPAHSGDSATIDKLQAMKESLDSAKDYKARKPLALARGVTEDNIERFMPYVEKIFVGSSVETRTGEFNMQKLGRIVTLAHER